MPVNTPPLSNDSQILINRRAVLNITQLINAVISNATKDGIDKTFLNIQESIPVQNALIEIGYPRGKTSIQINNSTAYSATKNNM